MKNLHELFEHQLKDLYSAESQLIEALPKMAKHATDHKLKSIFESHLKETEQQKARIEEICATFELKPGGEKCKAMAGLINEANGFMQEAATNEVMDAGLIAEAQRVEHYEISGYGTAVRYAKELGYVEIAKQLQKTLDQEYRADELLNHLAESRLNKEAKA